MIEIKDKETIGEIVIGGIMKGIKEEVVEIGEANQGGQIWAIGTRVGGIGVKVQEEGWKIIHMK